MDSADSENRQRVECYNCYRLMPADSKFCPYCGHNQQEKSGYTLRTGGQQPAEAAAHGAEVPAAAPAAYSPPGPAPVQHPYGGQPYASGGGTYAAREGVNWVDVAKYGGVIGTILFIIVLVMEFAAVLYGFTYLQQMNSFPYFYPFYFITPYVIGLFIIGGVGYSIVYVLFVMIAAVSLAYVLRGSASFAKELRPISRGISSSTIFLIATLVMTYYFISIVVEVVLLGLGSSVSSPNFSASPWYMEVFGFVFAPVWEEIAVRVLLLGLPLMIISALAGKTDRPWWRYLTGGNLRMSPAAVFFLILSSVMFGLGHWLAGSGWGAWKIFPAAVAGLFMGFLFLKKGLFAAIIFHFSVDTQALLILSPNSNIGITYMISVVTIIWVIIGAVFFIYYLLVMLSFISSRDLLPRKVGERYRNAGAAAASASAAPPQQYQPQEPRPPAVAPPPPKQELHPYRPPGFAGGNVMRDPHMPAPVIPGEPVFGYMCSNCGSMEAKYADGKFVCVYCGHESEK